MVDFITINQWFKKFITLNSTINIFNIYLLTKFTSLHIQMHSQSRILPRLDQLYLQKQSYQAHKKKLTSIKRSGSLSKRSLNHSQLHQNQQQTKSIQSLTQSNLKLIQTSSVQKLNSIAPQNRMETIQQAKPGLSYWLKKMNPLQKRLKQQQIKENKRMRQKIKNTMSFVVQSNKLDSHAENYKGIKNMLNKFQIDHDSKKTKLKCQIVLKKITQIEKQKLKIQQSRILQLQKNQKPSPILFNLTKNTQTIAKLEKQQKQTASAKRNRLLTQKINLITGQSTRSLHKTALIKNQNTIKNNLFQNKYSILTRNRSQLTSKNNSLIRNPKKTKTFTPTLGNSSNYQRIKTQHVGRGDPKRLFNSSKLSNLSSQTAPQTNLKKDYKILRVNFTQKGEISRQIRNSQSKNRYEDQKEEENLNHSTSIKKHITSRIRTEATQKSIAEKFKRDSSNNRFDYQKKRIQRYVKSKIQLNVKYVTDAKNKLINGKNSKNMVDLSKKVQKICQKRPSIVQEKIEESMQTIDAVKKQEEKINKNERTSAKKGQKKQEETYFATQIM